MAAKGVSRLGRSAWACDFRLSGSSSCSFLNGFSIGFPMNRGSRRHWVWDWMVRTWRCPFQLGDERPGQKEAVLEGVSGT